MSPLELLQGETLRDGLRWHELSGKDAWFDIAAQMASALETAHAAGILHGDIKPANIFLSESSQAKLLDFGLAKIKKFRPMAVPQGTMATAAMSFATIPGTILGTIAYMAPEQAKGEQVDARADLYSLGVVLHEMATGELPLGGAEATRLPADHFPIVQKLIAARPSARYHSATEMLAALRLHAPGSSVK